MKESKDLEQLPEFNKTKKEIIRENAKDLNRNFFLRKDTLIDYANHRDRANTVQGELNEIKIKMSEENKDKDKKRTKLNVDSPKFTAKANPQIDNLTFNPLNNISNNKNSFNKFDEFDPSSN